MRREVRSNGAKESGRIANTGKKWIASLGVVRKKSPQRYAENREVPNQRSS